MNCSKFQIKVLTGPLAGFIITDANYDTFIAEHGGNGYEYAIMYGNTAGATMTELDMTIYADGVCSGVLPEQLFAYSGWEDDDAAVLALDDAAVEARTQIAFTTGGTITADYTANADPKFLWMAEPVAEPVKTKWFTTTLNTADIGPDETFDYQTGGATTNYRIIKSQFLTQQTDDPVQFRVVQGIVKK